MPERIPHKRTKGPVSTPAQRLVELQQEINWRDEQILELQATVNVLQRDFDRYHRMADTSFGGIAMAQIRADQVLWEAVLNSNPQIRAIFEIGTWQGGFSWWLWAQCEARGLFFQTYDPIVPDKLVPNFEQRDVFADAKQLGGWFRGWEPCIVFCDGGNKPRELNTFADELTSTESILFVHDWGEEILLEDIPDSLVMDYREYCLDLGSITRVFRLKGETDG